MTTRTETSSANSLARRFASRLAIGLSLVRAYRFVAELEPSPEPDPVVGLAGAFKAWRQALRHEDAEGGLDAVERTWVLLEAYRLHVTVRDAAIEAFRVRWACENAALRDQTINSLARFYRVLPFSPSSQSKYEYVLTRLLAGPIGPERKVASTEVLNDAVVALEAAWGARGVTAEENEVATITLALRYFASEATRHTEAASFTASGLLRRFGAFKASIGEAMFDPRLSVAVVETNVAVLNVLNQLLTHAAGQPLKWPGTAERTPSPVDPSEAGVSQSPTPGVEESADREALRNRSELHTSEVDLSGLDFVRSHRNRGSSEESALASLGEPVTAPIAPVTVAPIESSSEHAPTKNEAGEPTKPAPADSRDLKTGEVDLSGLEFVRRRPPPKPDPDPGPEPQPDATERPDASKPPAAEGPAPVAEVGQQPSVRAFELARVEENAAIIDRYMTGPRSPEVWQLDLDVFLGNAASGDGNPETSAAQRRRALELILTADDLICEATQEGPPSAEHRAKVRSVASGMLLLRTSLRRLADLTEGDPRELATLLYAADHLLWERLRLEASLKQSSRRQRPALLPRISQAAEAVRLQTRRLQRHRGILVRIVGAAVVLTTLSGMIGVALPALPVDPEVRLIQLEGLPGAGLFDDARAFRATLFISASRTFVLLGREERRSMVRALGAFAAERGFDSVSVAGPDGEPSASFKDEEVILDGELNFADLAAR